MTRPIPDHKVSAESAIPNHWSNTPFDESRLAPCARRFPYPSPARGSPDMQVTAIHIRALEARRFQDPIPNQQIRIDHNSTISLVVKEGTDRMRVEFGYTTSYGPLGVIKVEGNLTLSDPNAGAAADGWATSRNLPPEMAQAVHSAIMGMAVPEAVGLAKELRLPPPIPLPQIQFQGQQQAPKKAPDPYGAEVG
jgi:hypothetical protein